MSVKGNDAGKPQGKRSPTRTSTATYSEKGDDGVAKYATAPVEGPQWKPHASKSLPPTAVSKGGASSAVDVSGKAQGN